MRPLSFQRHRFPADVIRQAVWLYFRFTLSFRDVEEMLAQRGIDVSYETIRCWHAGVYNTFYTQRQMISRPPLRHLRAGPMRHGQQQPREAARVGQIVSRDGQPDSAGSLPMSMLAALKS